MPLWIFFLYCHKQYLSFSFQNTDESFLVLIHVSLPWMRNLPNFQHGRFEICFQLTKGLLVSVYSGDRNHASFVVSEKSVQRMINAAVKKEQQKERERKENYYSTENCRKQLAFIGLREEKGKCWTNQNQTFKERVLQTGTSDLCIEDADELHLEEGSCGPATQTCVGEQGSWQWVLWAQRRGPRK